MLFATFFDIYSYLFICNEIYFSACLPNQCYTTCLKCGKHFINFNLVKNYMGICLAIFGYHQAITLIVLMWRIG